MRIDRRVVGGTIFFTNGHGRLEQRLADILWIDFEMAHASGNGK